MQPKRVVIQPGALAPHILPRRRRSPLAARIVALVSLLLLALAGAAVFALSKQPQWRAERARLAIGIGTPAATIEDLLNGRVETVYQERMAAGWLRRSRDEFAATFSAPDTETRGARRLRLTFRGPLGNSAGLLVEFNAKGEVARVRAPGAED